eukprot:gene3608-7179_t
MAGIHTLDHHLGDLKLMIENGQFLTYRYLSHTLNIDITTTKRLMSEFLNSQTNLRTTHLISEVEREFSKIFSSHVYSIQKETPSNLFLQLYATDMDQANENISCQGDSSFLANRLSALITPDIVIQPIGQRHIAVDTIQGTQIRDPIKSSTVNKPSQKTENSTKSAKSSSSLSTKDFFTNTSKPLILTVTPNTPANTTTEPIIANIKPTTNTEEHTTTKSIAKTTKAKTNPISKSTSGSNNNGSSSMEVDNDNNNEPAVVPKVVPADDDSDAEWDDGSGFVQKPKIRPVKKIKDMSSMFAESESEHTVHSDNETDNNNIPDKKKKKEVFGAMNEFVKTTAQVTAVTDNDGGENTTTNTAPAGKRKRRTLVEKMFADEKGYLVTEMVWEEVTDDESTLPIAAPKKPVNNNSNTLKSDNIINKQDDEDDGNGKKGKQPSKKKSKTLPEPGAQKSISSFFGKK